MIGNGAERSYSLFLYANHGIKWTKSDGKSKDKPDLYAQIGLMSHDGRFITVPASGTEEVERIDQ